MGYVDSNLMRGETVMHRAKLHKILFLQPGIFFVALCSLGIWLISQTTYNPNFAYLCFIVGLLLLVPAYLTYISSEYAVTNKRVIVKIGVVSRRTMETLLQKIEAISVDQTIFGRMCNYGTITVIGTGGTQESFENIADPLGFRRAVQEQTDAKERLSPN